MFNIFFLLFSGATVETGVYALSCILLIMGALCQVRGLMIPYLILQMLVMIVVILVGIALSVFLFFFHVITGAVAAGVVLIISFLLIYFWIGKTYFNNYHSYLNSSPYRTYHYSEV